MPTRQTQADFEVTLINALKKKEVTDSITQIIIQTITSALSDKFKFYDNKISQLETEIEQLKILKSPNNNTPNSMESQKNVEQKLDHLQQQHKNNTIRIMHLKEDEKENLTDKVMDIFEDKLKLPISHTQVVNAYRVGKNTGSPRHVLVTFQDNATKMKVYSNKRLLKGTSLIMKEDLTVYRLNKMKSVSEEYGFKNVWSVNGSIFAKTDKGVQKINLY